MGATETLRELKNAGKELALQIFNTTALSTVGGTALLHIKGKTSPEREEWIAGYQKFIAEAQGVIFKHLSDDGKELLNPRDVFDNETIAIWAGENTWEIVRVKMDIQEEHISRDKPTQTNGWKFARELWWKGTDNYYPNSTASSLYSLIYIDDIVFCACASLGLAALSAQWGGLISPEEGDEIRKFISVCRTAP